MLLFLVFEYFSKPKPVPARNAVRSEATEVPQPRLTPAIVAGFQVPENLRYHPGHTWALSESPNLVRVGLDDFAIRLVGKLDRITLPQRGQWIRQGQKVWTVMRDGKSVDMLSPIEGSISEINDAVAHDPELARNDPYGEGWLIKVESPDAKTNFRNLLGGSLARLWTQNAAQRLHKLTPVMSGMLAQDGGVAIDKISDAVPDHDWATLAREFFLS